MVWVAFAVFTEALIIGLLGYYIFWKVYFLRDPDREIPLGKNLVSPADGRIISIRHLSIDKLSIKKGIGAIETLASDVGKKVTVVSIFMSLFDVHVNRSPCKGKIISIKHTKGNFFCANNLKSLLNERNEILMQCSFGRMKLIQIAGYLARRIECFVKEGYTLNKGERFGLINLGSQVTMLFPTHRIDLRVKLNDRVKAGRNVIGVIK